MQTIATVRYLFRQGRPCLLVRTAEPPAHLFHDQWLWGPGLETGQSGVAASPSLRQSVGLLIKRSNYYDSWLKQSNILCVYLF